LPIHSSFFKPLKKELVSRAELLRCQVRYFNDGAAIGNDAFVEPFFENQLK